MLEKLNISEIKDIINSFNGEIAMEMRTNPEQNKAFHKLIKSIIKDDEKYEKWVKCEIDLTFTLDTLLSEGQIKTLKEELESTLMYSNGSNAAFQKAKIIEDIINNYNKVDDNEKLNLMNKFKEYYCF